MRVHNQRREFLTGRSLAHDEVAEIGELQVDDVKSLRAQDSIQRLLQRWHRDPQPVEAPGGNEGLELQQPFGDAVPATRILHQHDVATVDLHGLAALVDVELVVDQHYSRQVIVSRELGHQPMHPRLSTKARRARRHL